MFGSYSLLNGVASPHPYTLSRDESAADSPHSSPHQLASSQGSVTGTPQRSAATSHQSSPARPVLFNIPEAAVTTGKLSSGAYDETKSFCNIRFQNESLPCPIF